MCCAIIPEPGAPSAEPGTSRLEKSSPAPSQELPPSRTCKVRDSGCIELLADVQETVVNRCMLCVCQLLFLLGLAGTVSVQDEVCNVCGTGVSWNQTLRLFLGWLLLCQRASLIVRNMATTHVCFKLPW